ncbi:MAG: AI-2 transport protein TqsA [Candidatus Izimaplasma bacterium HR2]|nr:MAG: AI-2 transport protein TqsA [Candidatus Izimaplasma bacterium HR2]
MDEKNKLLSDKTLNKALKVLGIILLFLAVLYMASQFSSVWSKILGAIGSVLVPVALAWLISLVIYPIIKLLERRGVGPRGLSVTVVYIGTAVVIGLMFYYITPFVLDQVAEFFEPGGDYDAISDYFKGDFKTNFIFGQEVYDWLADTINDSGLVETTIADAADNLSSRVSSTMLSIITIIFILPILLLFYLLDYELVNDSLRSIIPTKYEKGTSELGSRLNQTVGAYVRGQLFLMVAIGTVATIIYKLIGLKYFFIFGLIVGVTNIIPYFGAIIAMIPVVIYTVITRDQPGGVNPLFVVGVNVGLQFIEGNIFQPIIMGRQLSIHPLIIIVSILFFGSLFGTLGVIFASPIAATIRVLIEFYKEKKELLKINEGNAPPAATKA